MSLFEHIFKIRILANPFLLHGKNMRRTSIPNFKFVRCIVIKLQRSVTKWYFDLICIDLTFLRIKMHIILIISRLIVSTYHTFYKLLLVYY